jgi:hypothetical protein
MAILTTREVSVLVGAASLSKVEHPADHLLVDGDVLQMCGCRGGPVAIRRPLPLIAPDEYRCCRRRKSMNASVYLTYPLTVILPDRTATAVGECRRLWQDCHLHVVVVVRQPDPGRTLCDR